MAVLPFRPTPFFANKNRAFWRLQLAGWGGAMLLRAMSSLANAQRYNGITAPAVLAKYFVIIFHRRNVTRLVVRKIRAQMRSRPECFYHVAPVIITVNKFRVFPLIGNFAKHITVIRVA